MNAPVAFTLTQITDAAKAFLTNYPKARVIAFFAPMGAGKTTFIKSLVHHLGSADTVTSPTFALVNEYTLRGGNKAWHFDFYRVNKPEEALDIGIEEYFYSGNYCFIEWPENIHGLLPENTLKVAIDILPDGMRSLRPID